jgi:hypothetical protein
MKLLFFLIFAFMQLKDFDVYADIQVNGLSDGACWYEFKDTLKVVSFNDSGLYTGNRGQIESELEALVEKAFVLENVQLKMKTKNIDLMLHCGGYGVSLVAKLTSEGNSFCLWAKLEKGRLALRSLGVLNESSKNPNELCDGYKWGEFLLGVQSAQVLDQLLLPQWTGMIKEIKLVSESVYKIVVKEEFEFREFEVIDQIQNHFGSKNLIRYVEFNDYRHPVGEAINLKN